MTDPTGRIILDQPWQLEMFHLLQIKYALRIEVNTGMRHSKGSVLNQANAVLLRNGVITKPLRTKRLALRAMEDYIAVKEQEALNDHA